jgi:hypothetical protein
MQLQYGDMWTAWDSADLFAITTNSTITKDGRLVMGRGIAQQARDRFPGIDKELASQFTSGDRYGLLVSPQWPAQKLAAFQVKIHWRSKASLDLIEYSASCLLNGVRRILPHRCISISPASAMAGSAMSRCCRSCNRCQTP